MKSMRKPCKLHSMSATMSLPPRYSLPTAYSSIPEEIIERILKCLDSTHLNDRYTLFACFLVSQQFYRIAYPLGYRSVTCCAPADEQEPLQKDIATFTAKPEVAQAVKTLLIQGSPRNGVETDFVADEMKATYPSLDLCMVFQLLSLLPRLSILYIDSICLLPCTSTCVPHNQPSHTVQPLKVLHLDRVLFRHNLDTIMDDEDILRLVDLNSFLQVYLHF